MATSYQSHMSRPSAHERVTRVKDAGFLSRGRALVFHGRPLDAAHGLMIGAAASGVLWMALIAIF